MTEEVKKKHEVIINNNSLLQFTDETLVIGECIMIMTEEQRKCSKIIKSSSIHPSPRVANSLYECIRVTISLAKEVFNKDITEEEAKEIFNNAWELNTNLCEDNYDNFWNDIWNDICNEIKKLNK